MSNIQVVLFDVDGTLLDTVDYIVFAYAHTARTHGFPDVTREMVIAMGGQALEECYAVFAPGFAPRPLCETHRGFQLANTGLVAAYPSSSIVLAQVRARGLRTAAVTSRRTTAHLTLEETGLAPLLDVVVTGDDVARCKPDPEGVHLALNHLGAAAASAVMVGDTAADVRAARSAGLRTVGVTYGFYSQTDYETYPPDYIIDDLSDLPGLLEGIG